MQWVSDALHDLCQPLTALECRLVLGLRDGSEDEMRVALKESMLQCERLIDGVRAMQVRLG